MKIKALSSTLHEEQKKLAGIDINYSPRWQITVDKEYLVIEIGINPASSVYGQATMYTIVDDFGKLVPAPSLLFEVTHSDVPSCWKAQSSGLIFSLRPKEFVDDPYLSEKILDREPEAIAVLNNIIAQIEAEN